MTLALWRVTDPGNVGTLLRTADAFGAAVSLSPECADPLGPRAVRASAGAIFRVPLVEWDDAPARCVGLVAHGGGALAEVELEPPLTILLGSERRRAAGLPSNRLLQGDDPASRRGRVAERRRGGSDCALRALAPFVSLSPFLGFGSGACGTRFARGVAVCRAIGLSAELGVERLTPSRTSAVHKMSASD